MTVFFEVISRHSKNFHIGKESFNEVAVVAGAEPTGWNILYTPYLHEIHHKECSYYAVKGMQYHGIGFTYTHTVEAPGQIK